MFIILFYILISNFAFSQDLILPELSGWEKQDKTFGAEAIFTKKNHQDEVVIFTKVDKSISTKELDSELNRIINQRKTSTSKPWSEVELESSQKIPLAAGNIATFRLLRFSQSSVKYSGFVAVYPAGKSYFLAFGKFPHSSFNDLKDSIVPYLKSVKVVK